MAKIVTKKDRPYKSTNAEIELRVQTVIQMHLQGFSRIDIVRYAAKKWNVASRQTDEYLLKAKEGIKEIASGSKEEQIRTAIARFQDLYQKSYKNQDYKLCQVIQESINKLLGLNAESKLGITVSGSVSPDKWLSDNAE